MHSCAASSCWDRWCSPLHVCMQVLVTEGLWVPLVHVQGVYVLPGIPRYVTGVAQLLLRPCSPAQAACCCAGCSSRCWARTRSASRGRPSSQRACLPTLGRETWQVGTAHSLSADCLQAGSVHLSRHALAKSTLDASWCLQCPCSRSLTATPRSLSAATPTLATRRSSSLVSRFSSPGAAQRQCRRPLRKHAAAWTCLTCPAEHS